MAAIITCVNTCLLKRFKSVLINKYNKNLLSYYSNELREYMREMPKDNTLLVNQLRESRIKSAKKLASNNKFPSNVVQLHVLGNGSIGNPRALYVSTDRNSYLFNCGEGTQRLAHEHKYCVIHSIINFL
jgi:hypothetical protein